MQMICKLTYCKSNTIKSRYTPLIGAIYIYIVRDYICITCRSTKVWHLIALFAFIFTTTIPQPTSAMRVAPKTKVYPIKAEDIKYAQSTLYDNGCYGNQLGKDQKDGRIGDLSRRAFWVFADTVKLKYPNLRSVNISDRRYRFKDYKLLLTLPDLEPNFCRKYGQKFLSKWYDDKNFHYPGRERSDKITACNKDNTAGNYLDQRGKISKDLALATRLDRPLTLVVKEFKKIFLKKDFPDPVTDPNVLNSHPGAIAVYEDHAEKVDEYEDILETLKKAQKQFRSLALRYGLQKKKSCIICIQINDWKFLSNLAQANGGNIVYDDGKGEIVIIPVDSITKKLMHTIKGNIFLYQRMSVKWNRLVKLNQKNKKDKKDSKVKKDKKEKQRQRIIKELYKIKEKRSKILLALAKGLHEPKVAAYKIADETTNPLMTSLKSQFDCVGFDGSSLD